MRMALQAGGFVLEEATDAEQGLKLAHSSKPDCILLGDVLPDAKGREVLESLRRSDGTLPCAVVMLAEVGSADIVSEAMRAGALDYLVKDRLDANTLRRAIGSAVRHFRLIEAQRIAERRNAQFAAIVAASDNAIISTDADFVIQTWNAEAERLFGYREAEARQHILTELLVPEAYEAENASLYATVMSGRAARTETLRRHKDGHLVPVEINTSPIFDRSGTVVGATIIYRDISERRRAEEARRALAESEERFRVTFQNAAVGIAHIATDGKMLRFNEAMSRIVGWPADELLTKSFQEIICPDDLTAEDAPLEQLREGKIDSHATDRRFQRKDGTIGWIRRTVSCVRKGDRSVDYFVTVIEDISARKRAEEQVHLLMREADHRVKNLLGLVQAIARQTTAGSVEDFIGRFTERLQALAAHQDLLGRDQRRGTDLEDLVRAQLAHFADLVGSRITMHGPKLHLNATAAQTIGLALHELATNAGKYGALRTDGGRVDVSWQSEGDVFTISWTERDGPPVQPPKHRGFGSTVIESMAKLATDGEVQLDYASSGLVWRLRCPIANALKTPT
jgi:PAS domain S-box-containing protein